MLSDEDRHVIHYCHLNGVTEQALAWYFSTTPRHISGVIRRYRFEQAPTWVYHFQLGAKAERLSRDLTYASTKGHKEAGIQTDLVVFPEPEQTIMHRPSVFSLERRMEKKQRKNQQRQRLKENLESLRARREERHCEDVLEECADEGEEDKDLAESLLENMTANLGRHLRGRRYTSEVVDFSYVISRYSMAAYDVLRHVLPLPSRQTISCKFKALEKQLMSMYENEELCHALMTRYFERVPMSGENEEIQCTLAVDAFSINIFSTHVKSLREATHALGSQQKQSFEQILDDVETELNQVPGETDEREEAVQLFNNCFLIMLIPFRWDRPPLVVSMFPMPSGSANSTILRRLFRIIDVCSVYNIRVRTIATDGDPGYGPLHTAVSQKWLSQRKDSFEDLLEIFQRMKKVKCPLDDGGQALKIRAIPIADPLHALKIARSRVLEKTVVLSLSPFLTVSLTNFMIFEQEKWFSDRRNIARMSDYHAIEMFSPRVLCSLIDNGCYTGALYMWGWTALMMVIRVPFLSKETRLSLLISSFEMFRMFLNQVLDKKYKGTGVHVRAKEGCVGVTFYETGYLTRVIHLIFALYIELSTNGKMLRLSAFGTHCNENAIGRARVAAGGTNNFNVFQCHFAKCEVSRHLEHALGIVRTIRTRDNIGGAKLDAHNYELLVDLNLGCDTKELVEAFAENNIGKCWIVLRRIADFLRAVTARESEIPKVYAPNKAASAGIIARLISFQNKTSQNTESLEI